MRVLLVVFTLCSAALAQKNPNFQSGRSTIVHLFEWKWSDIADECERFLQYHGFAGVQTSPPNENLVIASSGRPWWERYQPVSYTINTRSGDESAFLDMTTRCNAVGVRIYIDLVVNHMTAMSGTGTAGNSADHENRNWPGVPFSNEHFHVSCPISNDQDADNLRTCELNELSDLDQSQDYVREKIVEYLNHLVDLGVAGFRVDAAKLMDPKDLGVIFSTVKDLNTDFGFEQGARPFIYQEVIDFGTDAISKYEYNDIGAILEFRVGVNLGNAFQGGTQLAKLENWGPDWELIESGDGVAFIDNHDNQRNGDAHILTYKNDKLYKMAIAFMQAHPYGTTRIMSSYFFDDFNQGPPQDASGNIISPSINDDNTCGNGWVCEHRWREIFKMTEFRNTVEGTEVENWWSNGDQQIAFSRGNKGFIAFTNGGDLDQRLNTNLPAGTYCDIVSADIIDGQCTGRTIEVADDGTADIKLGYDEMDGYLAIHVNAKV